VEDEDDEEVCASLFFALSRFPARSFLSGDSRREFFNPMAFSCDFLTERSEERKPFLTMDPTLSPIILLSIPPTTRDVAFLTRFTKGREYIKRVDCIGPRTKFGFAWNKGERESGGREGVEGLKREREGGVKRGGGDKMGIGE
jgi:hypothetical protein